MNIILQKLAVTGIGFAVLLFASGCSAVLVSQPIGEKPHVLVAADWDGYWLVHPELNKKPVMIHVKVTNPNEGRMQLACLEDDATKVQIFEATVRESGSESVLFVTLRVEAEKADLMAWGCLGRGEDLALVWVPDVEKFAALVRDGKLRGKLVERGVSIEPPTAEELKTLVPDAAGMPFYPGAPAVFHRVAR